MTGKKGEDNRSQGSQSTQRGLKVFFQQEKKILEGQLNETKEKLAEEHEQNVENLKAIRSL